PSVVLAADYGHGPSIARWRAPCVTFAMSSASVRRRRCGERSAVVHADAAEAWQLHAGVAQIEPGDETKDVQLDPLDPADLDSKQTPQRGLDAGSAVGQACIGQGAEVLPDGIRRQGGGQLGYRPQHS